MQTWDRVMSILSQGKIKLAPLVTDIFELSRWREAFQMCEEKKGAKVLIRYDE
jgi:L-iditol 2-dehydrogenase